MSTSQSPATRCVAALVCWFVGGSFAARDVAGQQKPRVNPLIARLEQGQAALSGTDWMFISIAQLSLILIAQLSLSGAGEFILTANRSVP